MTVEILNNSKLPIIVFDKKLEKFREKTLFPEKLEKANEILSNADKTAKELTIKAQEELNKSIEDANFKSK
jgi:hypothetical protein